MRSAPVRQLTSHPEQPKVSDTLDRTETSRTIVGVGLFNLGLGVHNKGTALDEEIKALNEGKKEVFVEAKGEGFDVKVLKEILRLRKQDKDERDEQESLLDLYLRAMESANSSQARAA